MRLPISQELRYHRTRGGVTSGQTNILKENDGGNDTVVNRSGLVVADVQQGLTYGRGLFSLEDDLYTVFDDKIIKYGYSPTDQRIGTVDTEGNYEFSISAPDRIVVIQYQPFAFTTFNSAVTLDGENWTITSLPTSDRWRQGCWDGSQFILVGASGSNGPISRYLTSTDGVSWVTNNLPFSINSNSVATIGNRILIVGYHDSAYSSDGGATWTEISTGGYDNDFIVETVWTSVKPYGGEFIVGGYTYNENTNLVTFRVAITRDGTVSDVVNIYSYVDSTTFIRPFFEVSDTTLVYVIPVDEGSYSSKTVLVSTTGRDWNKISLPLKTRWSSISSDGETFALAGVVYSESGVASSTPKFLMSKNGVEWEEQIIALPVYNTSVIFGLSGLCLMWSATSPTSYGSPTFSTFIPSAQPLPVDYEITIDGETLSMFDFALGL